MPGVRHRPTAKTRKLVGDLVLLGRSQEEIAKRLSICIETLVSHYSYEIYELKHDINCEIENIALEKARKGDWAAINAWLKCKAGWAPARSQEEKDSDDKTKSLIEKLLEKVASHG